MASRVQIESIHHPLPHYLVSGSSKKLHGWYGTKYRECTSERLIINPYCGCGVGCFFCYARSLPGYFSLSHRQGNRVYVFSDFDRAVKQQLAALEVASCGYLSAVSDPFQKINEYYRLSEKIIKVFVALNIPIEFITKQRIPEEALMLLPQQKDSFGQVSILTLDEKLRTVLSPEGADTRTLLDNLTRLKRAGIFTVARIDPIIPYVTDNKESLAALITALSAHGASHVVASVLDIPLALYASVVQKIRILFGQATAQKYTTLYRERIGYLNAALGYRQDLFHFLKEEAAVNGLTFSLCMEFKKEHGKVTGLNEEFSTSYNCEGKDVPLYRRRGERFYPIAGCRGNCLRCTSFACGMPQFYHSTGKTCYALTLKDYRIH